MSLFRAYSPNDKKPLEGHALLMGVFGTWVGAMAVAQQRSGRGLPDRYPAGDLFLMSVGTYKLSRLITKDRITGFVRAPFTRLLGESERPGEVNEEPRGEGVQQAIGQLLVCPYCVGQWVGTAFLATYLRDPKLARTVAALFTVVSGSDLLQEAWVAVDKRA
jgi:hypothetical protein